MEINVLKQPRGYIKFIEIFMSITAFALLADYSGTLTLHVICKPHLGTEATGDTTIMTTTETVTTTRRHLTLPQKTTTITTDTTTDRFPRLPTRGPSGPLEQMLNSINQYTAGGEQKEENEPRNKGSLVNYLTHGDKYNDEDKNIETKMNVKVDIPGIPTPSPGNPLRPSKRRIEISIPIEYPFKLVKNAPSGTNCEGNAVELVLSDKISSPAIFFMFTGVTFFLFCLFALILYVVKDEMYSNISWVNLGDLAMHSIFAIFWLSACIAFAVGIGDLKDSTMESAIIGDNQVVGLCANNFCSVPDTLSLTKLVLAEIFGWVNLFICSANLWLIFKETGFYENNTE